MNWILALLAIVAVGGLWLRNRQNKHAAGEAPRAKTAKSSAYSAVSVQPGENACRTVLALKGRRLLARDNPQLPLPGCSSTDCQCVFKHHPDRREPYSDRRLHAGSLVSQLYEHTNDDNRRDKPLGRRKDDG